MRGAQADGGVRTARADGGVRAARADGGSSGSSGKGGNYGSSGRGGRGEKGKTLSEFWDFDKVYLLIILILINMFYQTNFLLLGSL